MLLIHSELCGLGRSDVDSCEIKKLLFISNVLHLQSNCSTFAFYNDHIYIAKGLHLQCKEALNDERGDCCHLKKRKKRILKSLESIFYL